MSHTSFVSHEGSQMARLGLIVLREGLHFAPVALASLPREESKGTVPRGSELSMTLKEGSQFSLFRALESGTTRISSG